MHSTEAFSLILLVFSVVRVVPGAPGNNGTEPSYLTTRKNVVDDVILRFFNGNTFTEFVETYLPQGERILRLPGFSLDPSVRTVFYIHGYDEVPNMTSIHTVVDAYLQRKDHNVIAVDWYNMAQGSYTLNAAPNTVKVGIALGDVILSLLRAGLKKESVHVVGHSLGGQVAGFTGKRTKEKGVILPRISALDPAFPLFYPGLAVGHISKDDAEFVDVIHTDAGFYGAPIPTGTVDFWPNGGVSTQPGCPKRTYEVLKPDDLCSHWCSWKYWAESVISPKAFQAVSCTTYIMFKMNHCSEGETVYMGIGAKVGIHGNYYLVTRDTAPHGMGKYGTKAANRNNK